MTSPPLAGVRVVVTRAEAQAEGLAEGLIRAGATVALLPLLEVVPPADPRPVERAASELALYDWLVLTSANAVEAFLPLTGGALPQRLRVAVVGEATAAALRAFEVEPHLIAGPDADGLLAALSPHVARRRRVLLPQATDARPNLADGLAAAGAEAVVLTAYDKRLPAGAPAQARALFAEQPIGWVTFTSPRIVRHFFTLLAEILPDHGDRRRSELRAASIGRVTSAELRRQDVEPAAEAAHPTTAELVTAIALAARGADPEQRRS